MRGQRMTDWSERLAEFLAVGDAPASGLDAEARATAGRYVLEASGSTEPEAFLHELDEQYPVRIPGGQLHARRTYLRGQLVQALGRPAEALETLLPLCEKLEQESQWPDLAAVADEILQSIGSVEAARYLAKAVEVAGAAVAPEGSLMRALRLFPEEHRVCWLAAEELERGGESERALALFVGCLPSLVEGRDFERIEETFIRLEEAEDAETVRLLLDACLRLAAAKEWKRAEGYLETLLPRIRKAGLVPEAWERLLKLLPKAPADSNLRRLLMEIAPDALPGVEGALDLLGRSGILDPKVKVSSALRKLDELLEFAPGYRVLHASWGAGKIRANEGDALIIDFPDRPSHRMSLKIARNALTVIPPDDLRVLWTEKPDEVREVLRTNPAQVAYLAIREMGGRVTTQQLRRRMTAEMIPTSRWATWWKEARQAMEQDERFDLSEGFRQVYAIRTREQRDEDRLLPRMDRRRGIRANLNLLRRFLEQHPQYQERAVKMYSPVLTRWLRDEKTHPEAALAICLLLDRWEKLEMRDLEASLRAVMSRGVEASAYANVDDQRFLVSNALRLKGLEREAALFALGSRYPEIREMGWAQLRKDPEQGRRTLAELLSRPEERPHTALSVALMLIAEDTPREAFHPPVWRVAGSLCRLVERTGRDVLRDQVMRLFSPRSSLFEVLERETPADEEVGSLGKELTRWRESERFLFPILEFFDALGLSEMVTAVRSDRMAATNRLIASQHSEEVFGGLYMTRSSYERLERERAELRRELKEDIPRIIEKAREQGDLSENAEYDAAKEKQARFTSRVSEIDRILAQATMIENVEVPEGQIGPGSWVTLRLVAGANTGAERHFWVLGEGDSRFGDEVVSASAPLGKLLLGRRIGDRVTLDLEEGAAEAEIVAAQKRLPQSEPAERG
ncbi:MAG: hypothetical protein GF330_07615 [Candidatus Eisenbacteria bacterium]|nr:hypothetical protein [Candidatus Eisenbacteria bacterium]